MVTKSTDRWPFALAAAALLAGACSKAADDSGPGGSGGNGGTPAAKGTCDKADLQILFAPMYSSFNGGATKFKVPAVVNSINPTSVTWSASDPSMVDLQPDAATGGVMISPAKAGTVTIIASAGGLCGTSLLTITASTPDELTMGSERYNNGIVLTAPPRGGGGGGNRDAGVAAMREVACTNCHGDTATNGFFKTVAHSPQQTGGFSDQELIDIFTKGVVPPNGYFDEDIIDYDDWQRIHRWEMSAEQAKGMVVYLRSLTPVPQKGMRGDFGGRRGDGGFNNNGDGGPRRGRGDGGGQRGDGGGMGGGMGGVSQDASAD